MVKFLTTLLLALIIFVPACLFVSKFFALSDQAKNNFGEFASTLTTFYENNNIPVLAHQSDVLILDSGTALVYFEEKATQVKVNVISDCVGCSDYSFTLERPGRCSAGKSCLCLFRKVEYGVGDATFSVKGTDVLCDDTIPTLRMVDCGIGTPHSVKSYRCESGFLIERHLADKASLRVGAYYDNNRRISIQMEKEGKDVLLSGVIAPPAT